MRGFFRYKNQVWTTFFFLKSTNPLTLLPRRTPIVPYTLRSNPSKQFFSKMFSSAIIASLLLGLSRIPSAVAQPVDASSFIITLLAIDYFPNAKGDLSPFDVDVQFVGYNATTKLWLTGLDPASGSSDEEKAKLITAAAYAKPFDANDPDMTQDVDSLLAAVASNTTTIQKRDTFSVSTGHAVVWSDCSAYFSCVSGVDCRFSLGIGQSPRSQCQENGSSNCCISWSTYSVAESFFSTTDNSCNSAVAASGHSSASCEGHGGSDQGGDVCLSNRATGCS